MALQNYSPDDLAEVEDQFAALASKIRRVRTGMREAEMETVRINLGTTLHFLERLHGIMANIEGAFENQKMKASVRKTRERIMKKREGT